MAKQTSFAHQKQVLEQFSQQLSAFSKALESLSERYELEIFSLYEEQGMMEEIYMDYMSRYMQPMKDALLDLSARVSSEDIAFVEREIDFISSRS